MARDARSGAVYLGLFNLQGEAQTIDVAFASVPELEGEYDVGDIWKGQDLDGRRRALRVQLRPHGAGLYMLTNAR